MYCVTVYIDICSHRPVDIHNIYNQVQVKLLMKQDEFDDVPEFDDVFRDDDVRIITAHHV